MRQVFLVIALIVLCTLITVGQPRFLTVYNVLNVLEQAAVIGIVSAGVVMLMIGGGFDLSVGSGVVLGAYIVAIAFKNELPPHLAIFLALLGGAALGVVNGVGIAHLGIPSLIMTLGTLYAVRGGVLYLSGGETIGYRFPDAFTFIGKGVLAELPMPVIIVAVVYIIFFVIMKKTRFGLYTVAVGTDSDTAWRAGISAKQHLATLYIISGTLAALAGIVLTARIDAATVRFGDGYELQCIAAVVIGGTSLFGGRGTLPGTVLGVLFLAIVHNGINLLGVSPFLATFAIGALLLFSATIDIAATLTRRT
jgi:ribose/xylose/arabinose/galactoside ABC-type transport system permease subunit